MLKKLLILLATTLPLTGLANDDEVLNIDRSVSADLQLAFPNDENIVPNQSDFDVLNYVLMSNELGERFAVITLKNTASGNRGFEQKYLMALFADGTRKSPDAIKLNFRAKEIQSVTVAFGMSKFPILEVYANSN